ncbi:HAMP domain-containing sensor histidine kinase [Geothrix sp.]|jgi:signal transduction histidine kinase|uniref:sensor histidine kinase n=1 Tax=Geothrix sp. TaxID=1962974 RepID=UPI0025C095A2|nr:HAMP domain-containing sensor histidine kinase [Geothrix sp.]
MQEVHLLLIFGLATIVVMLLSWLALFSVVQGKNRVLQEQRKALEGERRLRRAQEAFTDNAHHELRTPVQILSGHLQMLSDLDPTPEQTTLLHQAQQTAAHLSHLVQSLLDLSSLGQGTLAIRPALTDLGTYLASLARRAEADAHAKGLVMQVAMDPLPHPLVCDAARLIQSLEALLDNAIGFSDRGTISFRMAARSQGRTWHLRFEIEDQGPGLPLDWERLMRPFEQEEQSLRRRRGGLGIGLPLAAGLIERLGGRIGFQPLTAGTLAWVDIPLKEEA